MIYCSKVIRTTISLGHGLFPKKKFISGNIFFYISLITLKKSELLYVWVTNKSKASKIIKLAFLILRGFDFQSGALEDHNVILLFV